MNWKWGWLWTENGVWGRLKEQGCEGWECDARRTGSIFYHCSELSSLMDPAWAEQSTAFHHIAQAGEGHRKKWKSKGSKDRQGKVAKEKRCKPPVKRIITTLKCANTLFINNLSEDIVVVLRRSADVRKLLKKWQEIKSLSSMKSYVKSPHQESQETCCSNLPSLPCKLRNRQTHWQKYRLF